MKQIKLSITGITPLLMHSERLANPFDDLTREIKAHTGKRKKTEDDQLEIGRLEWLGGLYYDADAGVHLPGHNIFSALVDGGKIHKLGTAIKRAALVQEDKVPLIYDGPSDPDALFAAKRFVDVRSVKVGTAKVARCRPIFKEWSCCFTVLFEESVLQQTDIVRCITDAGRMVGIGDYRPRFGRFDLVGAI
jgi:hypothetical protein